MGIIYNFLLQFALNNNTNIFQLEEFHSYLINQSQDNRFDQDDIIKSLRSTLNFIKSFDNNQLKMIEINKNVFYCKSYIRNNGICERGADCRFLHICVNVFLKEFCHCELDHKLSSDFNLKALALRNMLRIDYQLLKRYFKVFGDFNINYNATQEHKTERNDRRRRRNNQSNKNNFNNNNLMATNVPNLMDIKFTRKVEIEIPKEFVKDYNNHILFALINKHTNTNDNHIEEKEYLPLQFKAFITYKNESVAISVLEKREIQFLNYNIKIKEPSQPIETPKIEQTKPQIKRQLVKPLINNILLTLILRNEQWCNALKEKINFDTKYDIKISTRELVVVTNDSRKIDNIIKSFCNQFYMEIIDFDNSNKNEIDQLITEIVKIKKIYLLDYEKRNNSKLYIVGKKEHLDDFSLRYNSFESLRKNPNKKSQDEIVSKSIDIPKLPISGFNGLISLALTKLYGRFNLQDLASNNQDSKINITGKKSNVESALDCFKKIFNSIEYKRVDGIENLIKHSKNLSQIIKECLNKEFDSNLIYKIHINSNDDNDDEYGIFVTYFRNCPELDSISNTVYEQISKYLKAALTCIEINVTKYALTLNSTKWRTFEQENFNKTKCLNNFSYNLNKSQDEQMQIYLIGRKENCLMAKAKIGQFLTNNESKTMVVDDLFETQFLYLKHVAYNQKKSLESKHNINIEYKEMDKPDGLKAFCLIINECPKNLLNEIKTNIANICSEMKVRDNVIKSIPGVSDNYKSLFKQDIEIILRETCTYIKHELKPTKNKPQQNKQLQPTIPLSKTNGLNKIKQIIEFGNNKLCLEIGFITDTNADVIVNSTQPSLKLNCGSLSSAILNKAGQVVQEECNLMYPNGITTSDVALTSAGSLKLIQAIMHVTLGHFSDKASAEKTVKNTVNNCLKEMILNNFHSISFPSIGTGNVGYPIDIVSQIMVETSINFLKTHQNKPYTINIVTSEQFPDIFKSFVSEFSKNSLETNDTKASRTNLTFNKLAEASFDFNFKVVYKSDNDYSAVNRKIGSMCEKYITKESIRYECNEPFTENELNSALNCFQNCNINIQNNEIEFHGLKEEVANAKIKFSNLITEKNRTWSEQVRLSKDIQWKFEINTNIWKEFSIDINSSIESAFLKKRPNVTFTNENIENQTIWFNQMKLYDENGAYSLNVKRIDIKKAQQHGFVSYPDNWTHMPDDIDFLLVDVNETTNEYLEVVKDFKAKLTSAISSQVKIKIQRVQNRSLYEAYLTYKKKLKNKNTNENEMYLYHGTSNKSVNDISRLGFNRSYCGVNGVAYGHGVYFAVNSGYSHNYTERSSGRSSMFRVRVLVGETAHGNSTMKVAPKKVNGEPVDSTCDQSKTIFVAYHDNQCYPDYLISYTSF